MKPLLVSRFFPGADRIYERMAHVLEFSARQHCPGWEIDVDRMGPWETVPHYDGAQANWLYNTQKLDEWAEIIQAAPDGRLVVFLDADMLIIQTLAPALKMPFDFAYTVRDPTRMRLPLNGGCIMVRATDGGRNFMQAWQATNRRLITRRHEHMQYRRKYAGMNQASLGATLESRATDGVEIVKLPVVEWNCEDSSWAIFGPQTRILHIKGRLRSAVFRPGGHRPDIEELAKMWHTYEAQIEAVA